MSTKQSIVYCGFEVLHKSCLVCLLLGNFPGLITMQAVPYRLSSNRFLKKQAEEEKSWERVQGLLCYPMSELYWKKNAANQISIAYCPSTYVFGSNCLVSLKWKTWVHSQKFLKFLLLLILRVSTRVMKLFSCATTGNFFDHRMIRFRS